MLRKLEPRHVRQGELHTGRTVSPRQMCCSWQSWQGGAIKTFATSRGAIPIAAEFALLGLSLASVQYLLSVSLGSLLEWSSVVFATVCEEVWREQ